MTSLTIHFLNVYIEEVVIGFQICVFLRHNIGFVFAVNNIFFSPTYSRHADDKDSVGRDVKEKKIKNEIISPSA